MNKTISLEFSAHGYKFSVILAMPENRLVDHSPILAKLMAVRNRMIKDL